MLLIFSGTASAQIPTEGQLWTNADLVVGLKKSKDSKGKQFDRISLVVTGVLRFGNNVSRVIDDRIGVSLDFRFNKFFDLAAGYLHQKSSPLKTIHNEESRFVINGTLNKRVENFNFRFREQYEYKFRNRRTDTQNFRELVQINYFLKHHGKDVISPFVANEFFYDTLAKKSNRKEFRAGITRNLSKKISADFFYIRLDSTTINANGLGIGFRYKIR